MNNFFKIISRYFRGKLRQSVATCRDPEMKPMAIQLRFVRDNKNSNLE